MYYVYKRSTGKFVFKTNSSWELQQFSNLKYTVVIH